MSQPEPAHVQVFAVAPLAVPERVFYELSAGDMGLKVIMTTAGTIPVREVLGRMLRKDVGKRLYGERRLTPYKGCHYWWTIESDAQFAARQAAESPLLVTTRP